MNILSILSLLAKGALLSEEEVQRLAQLSGPEVYKALADKGRKWQKALARHLAGRISAVPIETTEWSYQLSLGRVSGRGQGDACILSAVDDDSLASFLWETQGSPLDQALSSLCVLSGAELLRDPIPPGPAGIVRRVNRVLSDLEPAGASAALTVAVLDIRRGVVDYCCAGTPGPLLYRAEANDVEECRESAGKPVGLDRDGQYTTGYVILTRGDVLLFPTDGLYKAKGSGGRSISPSQWRRRLRQFSSRTAAGIRRGLEREIRGRLRLRGMNDDATAVVIKRRGRSSA